MSQIETLKAEAEALEARQWALGNPIKHCEALEQVARKHGYANWRACRAALSDGSEEPDEAAVAPPMKRYRSDEWRFAIEYPAHWNVFPPVPANSPYETVRFASREHGAFHLVIVFREPRDRMEGTGEWLGALQRRLEQAGFGNFRTDGVPGGSATLPTLDFDKLQDGRTWSVRYHFVDAGTLRYTIGFGSNAPDQIMSLRQRMVQSFEVLPEAS